MCMRAFCLFYTLPILRPVLNTSVKADYSTACTFPVPGGGGLHAGTIYGRDRRARQNTCEYAPRILVHSKEKSVRDRC